MVGAANIESLPMRPARSPSSAALNPPDSGTTCHAAFRKQTSITLEDGPARGEHGRAAHQQLGDIHRAVSRILT
jgi:hypothetical protein